MIFVVCLWSWLSDRKKDAENTTEALQAERAKAEIEDKSAQAKAEEQRQIARQRIDQMMAAHQRWVEQQRTAEQQREVEDQRKAEQQRTIEQQREIELQREAEDRQRLEQEKKEGTKISPTQADRESIARLLKALSAQIAAEMVKKGTVSSARVNGFFDIQAFGSDTGADAIAMVGVDWSFRTKGGQQRQTSGYLLFNHNRDDNKWHYQPGRDMIDRTRGR